VYKKQVLKQKRREGTESRKNGCNSAGPKKQRKWKKKEHCAKCFSTNPAVKD
jgi:hypothetical protein